MYMTLENNCYHNARNAHSSIFLVKQTLHSSKIENSRYIFRPTLVLVKRENEIHNSNQILTHNTTTSKFQVHNDKKINLTITIPKRCSKQKKIHYCTTAY